MTVANNKSPISSSTLFCSIEVRWISAWTSSNSSCTLSNTGEISSQSNPTLEQRFCNFAARVREGKAQGTLSKIEVSSLLPCFSFAFISFQRERASVSSPAFSSPNTWGWRRTIFSATSCNTSSKVKYLSSVASWLKKTTCNNKSPSSSRKFGISFFSIASITS